MNVAWFPGGRNRHDASRARMRIFSLQDFP
jgi:hypothetical protein